MNGPLPWAILLVYLWIKISFKEKEEGNETNSNFPSLKFYAPKLSYSFLCLSILPWLWNHKSDVSP